ncbi:MAG: hypothetical protein PHY80_01750 [Rickettsiales bacterium]|nr:hypothetical protein [Rickettsiales bacterium]
MEIYIFDKNTSNLYVLNLIEDIKLIFSDISNFETNNYNILDIKFKEINTTLENDNTIWKSKIIFDFITSVN